MVISKFSKIIIISFSFSLLLLLNPLKADAREYSVTFYLDGNGNQTLYLPGPSKVKKVNVYACAAENRDPLYVAIALLFEGVQVAYQEKLGYARSGCPMWSNGGTAEGTALDFGLTSADAITIVHLGGIGTYYYMYVTYEEGYVPPVIQCGPGNAITKYVNFPWSGSLNYVLPEGDVKVHRVNVYAFSVQNRDGGYQLGARLLNNGVSVGYIGGCFFCSPRLAYPRSGFPAWSMGLPPAKGAVNFNGTVADTINIAAWWGFGAMADIYYTHEPPECTYAAIAVASISKDGINYGPSVEVDRDVSTPIYLSATGSSDPNSWDDISNGGYCEWNTDLNQGTPTFEQKIMSPPSPEACDVSLGDMTFSDMAYKYQHTNTVAGLKTPQCSCDTDLLKNCPDSFSASAGDPGVCYDQYVSVEAPIIGFASKRYDKVEADVTNSYQVLRIVDKDGTASEVASVSVIIKPPRPNVEPSAINLTATQPDYCTVFWPAAIFSWNFSDPDVGDSQSAYQIQVDNNSDFSSPEVDSCKVVNSGNSYSTGVCGACCVNPPCSCSLAYNTTYYWRLKVWDSRTPIKKSAWTTGPSFTTPLHGFINIGLTPSLTKPTAGEIITLIDSSKCYSAPGNTEYNCKDGALTQYAWDFSYLNPPGFIIESTIKGNATTSYATAGTYNINLRITDDICVCSKILSIGIGLSLPRWIEIPPY